MPAPKLGIPYHPKYINEAFEKTVHILKTRYFFEIHLLNWQHFDEKNSREIIDKCSSRIDGLLIPGGHYGLDFKLYGSDEKDDQLEKLFKSFLFQKALKKGMPILGICAGSALINVVLGGTIELLPKNKSHVNHDVFPLEGELAHTITVQPQTHLHDILRGKIKNNEPIVMKVNSWHHAANKQIAGNLRVSAQADDGVVEAVEIRYPGNPNCWGIQFHPEYIDPEQSPSEFLHQRRIIDAFRQASLQFQNKRQINTQIRANFFTHNSNSPNTEPSPAIQAKL